MLLWGRLAGHHHDIRGDANLTQGAMIVANENTGYEQGTPTPNPDLRSLDRLVGTWQVSGEAQGTVTYEWMEGGFFLIQHVDLQHE